MKKGGEEDSGRTSSLRIGSTGMREDDEESRSRIASDESEMVVERECESVVRAMS